MGFLLGAYAKQMAGKRVRSLQARMVRVQSQLRRATRDIEQRERYWNQMLKDTKNSVMAQSNNLMMGIGAGLQQNLWSSLPGLKDKDGNIILKKANGDLFKAEDLQKLMEYDPETWKSLAPGAAEAINQQMTAANQQNQRVTQALQASLQQTLAMQEQDVELRKEADMQVLKDLEDDLQTEKDSLESQIQLATKDYEACQEMEKAGVKSLTPNYTGQS